MHIDEIKQKIATLTRLSIDSISDDKEISDLVSDSFMLVELFLSIQEQFQIELDQEDLEHVITVRQLLTLIQEKLAQADKLQCAAD
ncbi:MAG: acyl carrier protein [Burkholderiales bacterium]|nr:acyl carrier protein [Burkholderiales bacterium]MDR4517401.1 acyl carrier protein [Nitrosomonas sp.]